nr:alpha/beta hydrolase-fold protein [Candidatus Freyrarchaeum guaymaensis]
MVNLRYRVDHFRSESLEGNPLGGPVERELHVYLPPGYFESDRRYPVIYFLHGYSGNSRKVTVTPRVEDNKNLPLGLIPPEVLREIDVDRIASYEKFDRLIVDGEVEPFIFVQPDGSLHLPHKHGVKDLTGEVQTKGSFYVNSPYTGMYEDYIVYDVVRFVESNYRTIRDRRCRAMVGGSMGGYGALRLCIDHPELFSILVALSPANITLDLLDWKLVIPIYEKVIGRELAEKLGALTWDDILDTLDLVFTGRKLLSSIERDEEGKIVGFNERALGEWRKNDLNTLIKDKPDALRDVHVALSCEARDEFGLTKVAEELHETLMEQEVEHQFEIYSDAKASLSPHMLGIAYNIIPAVKLCSQLFP